MSRVKDNRESGTSIDEKDLVEGSISSMNILTDRNVLEGLQGKHKKRAYSSPPSSNHQSILSCTSASSLPCSRNASFTTKSARISTISPGFPSLFSPYRCAGKGR